MSQFLYTIVDGDYCKVGVSNDPLRRLSDLQAGNPRTLQIAFTLKIESDIYAALDVESHIHDFLAHSRVKREWFLCSPWDVYEAVLDFEEDCAPFVSFKYCAYPRAEASKFSIANSFMMDLRHQKNTQPSMNLSSGFHHV